MAVILLNVDSLRLETALSALVALLYNGLLDGSPSGQTLGKRFVRIRVADLDTGGSIGVGRGMGRELVVAVLQNAGVVIPLAGFAALLDVLWPLWDGQRQCWHDKAVRSVVVRVPGPSPFG